MSGTFVPVILRLAPPGTLFQAFLPLGRRKLHRLLVGQTTLATQVADTSPIGGDDTDFGRTGMRLRPNIENVDGLNLTTGTQSSSNVNRDFSTFCDEGLSRPLTVEFLPTRRGPA